MKLLLITFELDPGSQVLAWQLQVALELAKLCKSVVVLTHKAAHTSSPENMRVYVFPPLLLRAPLRWFGGKWLMNLYVWRLCRRHHVNACFIHMNMAWGFYLAPVFHLLGIPVLLWYAHGTVSRKLKLAHRCVTRIVTSTPEGFRLPSKKVSVIGQGVDAGLYKLQPVSTNAVDIVTVGRVSARKNLLSMIDAMDALRELEPAVPFRLIIIGAALTAADRRYQAELEQRRLRSRQPERIILAGQLLPAQIVRYYESAFVHLNLSQTGSMDKTVMEALAAGCPVVTSNPAFHELLRSCPGSVLNSSEATVVASTILDVYRHQGMVDREGLRGLVVGKHDLATFGARVLRELSDIQV